MSEIKLAKGRCAYWRGCGEPPARGTHFCVIHGGDRVCVKCRQVNPPKLIRHMCMRCYSWWRRHTPPFAQQIAAYERARSARRAA